MFNSDGGLTEDTIALCKYMDIDPKSLIPRYFNIHYLNWFRGADYFSKDGASEKIV